MLLTDSITDFITNYKYIEESKQEIIDAYNKNNQSEEAIEFRSNSLDLDDYGNLSKEKNDLGKELFEKGEASKAIRTMMEAATLAEESGDYKAAAAANKSLAESYNKLSMTRKSIFYYMRYASDIDSLLAQEKKTQEQRKTILKKQQDLVSIKSDIALDESEISLKTHLNFLLKYRYWSFIFCQFYYYQR